MINEQDKQLLQEYREVIRDLLPIYADATDWQYFHGSKTAYKKYLRAIDKAKSLLHQPK